MWRVLKARDMTNHVHCHSRPKEATWDTSYKSVSVYVPTTVLCKTGKVAEDKKDKEKEKRIR